MSALEVELYETPTERKQHELKRDMFAKLVALEKLENAYKQSALTSEDYTMRCADLLLRMKGVWKNLSSQYATVSDFMNESGFPFDSTTSERFEVGVPLTQEGELAKTSGREILEAGQYMITATSLLRMGSTTAFDIKPVLDDIVASVTRLTPDLKELQPAVKWLQRMEGVAATEGLNEAEAQQCIFDLETLYNAFSRKIN